MLEATHQEASHAVTDPMDEDTGSAVPGSNQQMQDAQQQQQPEAMKEDLVKPVAHSVRLQGDEQGGQGTPKALASTLVSSTLPSATP